MKYVMNSSIRKLYIFALYLITCYSTYFTCKIINTPIYPFVPILRLHNIVILEKNDIPMYAIDFSPVEDITKGQVIQNLLLGKTIKGKIRIFDLSKIEDKNIKNQAIVDFQELEKIDPYLASILKVWGSSFQIYNRNCRHFTRFITQYY